MNPYVSGTDVLATRGRPVVVEVDETPSVAEVADRVVAEVEAAQPQQMTSVPNADGGRTVDGGGPPLPSFAPPRALGGRVLKSELPGVSDQAWTEFALAMKAQSPSAVSASNELGMFAMKPRRLADLGLVKNLSNQRSPTGRMIWVGEWVAPMTEKKFLSSAAAQYRAFAKSMQLYADGLLSGAVALPEGGMPEDLSLSGALAILHKCGPQGIAKWADEEARFPNTVDLVQRANGIF